jgi:DNA-binding SARP family transcriptional activator
VRFGILGTVAVDGPHGAVPVTAPRELALLGELLVHAGRPVTREHLADRIWGEQPVRRPAHAVHTLVCRLRGRLGDAPIATAGATYTLTPGELDAARFRELVGRARRSDPAAAVAAYGDALALWRGAPLAGVPAGACVRAEQLQLDELRAGALEERAWARLRLGAEDPGRLVDELVPLVEAYPFRERMRAALMLALYRGGQVAAALATYRRARAALVEGFGISPGAELRRLHEQILRADPSLAAPPPGRPTGAGGPDGTGGPDGAGGPGRPGDEGGGREQVGLRELRSGLRGLEARVADLETALAAMVDTPGRSGR